MDKSNLKNIIVLKNLPSNIVDEAIVILKPNKKIKKIEVLKKNKEKHFINEQAENNLYVVNEAEMIVNDYIQELEKKDGKNNTEEIIKEKYKRLKKYTLVSSIVLIMSIILHFI